MMFETVEEYIEYLKQKKAEHKHDLHWVRYDLMLTAVYEVLAIQSREKDDDFFLNTFELAQVGWDLSDPQANQIANNPPNELRKNKEGDSDE